MLRHGMYCDTLVDFSYLLLNSTISREENNTQLYFISLESSRLIPFQVLRHLVDFRNDVIDVDPCTSMKTVY